MQNSTQTDWGECMAVTMIGSTVLEDFVRSATDRLISKRSSHASRKVDITDGLSWNGNVVLKAPNRAQLKGRSLFRIILLSPHNLPLMNLQKALPIVR